jgi:CO/xanthine dehydrogenase FAD-binding subunit
MGDHRFYHAVAGAHRCQAVTPSDLATTLSALDARVVMVGSQTARTAPIQRFYSGPGETILRRGELVAEVRVPRAARRRVSVFEKLRLWEGDFAVVSSCLSLDLDGDGLVRDARLVLGSVAPTPYRATAAERLLVGRVLDDVPIEAVAEAWTDDTHPLANNAWKIDAAAGLVRRCLRTSRERLRTERPEEGR